MKPFKIPYARRASDNRPVDALCYNGEKDLTCYECNDTLSYRQGCEKTNKKSGLKYSVRAHFFHTGEGSGGHGSTSSCSGESTEHLLAKEIVAKFTKFAFYHQCETCRQDYSPLLYNDISNTKTEYHWRDPINNTLFVPDVAYLDEHGNLKSAIEIYHTHEIPDEKIRAFNNADIGWVEVKARHIIEQFNAKKNVAYVERSGVFRVLKNRCLPCEGRINEVQRAEREASRLREQQEALEKAEVEKLRLEDMKRRKTEREEASKREKVIADALFREENEKKAEAVRIQQEKKKELIRKKEEEAKINEKKRKQHYDKEREMNAKKARTDVLTPEQKQEILDKANQDHIDREYEDRRRHLMAYQDMIVNARKKRRAAKESNIEVDI